MVTANISVTPCVCNTDILFIYGTNFGSFVIQYIILFFRKFTRFTRILDDGHDNMYYMQLKVVLDDTSFDDKSVQFVDMMKSNISHIIQIIHFRPNIINSLKTNNGNIFYRPLINFLLYRLFFQSLLLGTFN